MPVKIERLSVVDGYRIRRIDEETTVNTTLLEMLRREYRLIILGLDPLRIFKERTPLKELAPVASSGKLDWASIREVVRLAQELQEIDVAVANCEARAQRLLHDGFDRGMADPATRMEARTRAERTYGRLLDELARLVDIDPARIEMKAAVSLAEGVAAHAKGNLRHAFMYYDSQDLLMDEIEREEKEAGRIHELANLKGFNLDAARTLRARLEQLLESTINGGSSAELEDVLSQVECMDDEMSDVRKLVERLEKPTKAARVKKAATKSRTAETERAARPPSRLQMARTARRRRATGAFVIRVRMGAV